MQRGKLNSYAEAMKLLLSPHHMMLTGSTFDEMETEVVLQQIRDIVVSDDVDFSSEIFQGAPASPDSLYWFPSPCDACLTWVLFVISPCGGDFSPSTA
eukprot:SAG31_NODE_15982_length_728_cov_1.384738_1_plen_98_part_00